MNNNKITRRTALKTIGLSSVAVGGIIMGTNCCSPKKEEPISYNEKDIIPCNALNCEEGSCNSSNETSCCESNANENVSKCICKSALVCPAVIDIQTIFLSWNECVREGNLPDLSNQNAPNFKKQCRAFLSKMNKIPKEKRADRCTECGDCNPECEHIENVQEQIVYVADFIKKVEAIT